MRTPRPLADLIDASLGPILAAQGFATTEILALWPQIVGEKLARYTQPLKLEWKRRNFKIDQDRRPEPGTLVVIVESALALDVLHLNPVILERINAYYGWHCVGKIVIKQGKVHRAASAAPARTAIKILHEEELARIAQATIKIGEESLRASLERLGTAILSEDGQR